MIKTEKGKTEVNGTATELFADYAMITEAVTNTLLEAGFDDKFINFGLSVAIKSAAMTEDEIIASLTEETEDFANERI